MLKSFQKVDVTTDLFGTFLAGGRGVGGRLGLGDGCRRLLVEGDDGLDPLVDVLETGMVTIKFESESPRFEGKL